MSRTKIASLKEFPLPLLKQVYEENLYPCKRCGVCCRDGEEVGVTKKEAKVIAKRLKMSFVTFKRKYCLSPSKYDGFWDIPTKPCPFLKNGNTCTIRSIRPLACRMFPFGRLYNIAKNTGKVEIEFCCASVREMFYSITNPRTMEI